MTFCMVYEFSTHQTLASPHRWALVSIKHMGSGRNIMACTLLWIIIGQCPKDQLLNMKVNFLKKPFYILGYVLEQCIEIW
jgi:hypothetical protein